MPVDTHRTPYLILVVERDVVLRGFFRDLLQHEGATALAAPCGAEALALVTVHTPAAILLDVHLPDMTSAEFIQRYRSRGGEAPLIVLTNQHEPSQCAELAHALGADAVVLKPFDVADLLATLWSTVDQKQA